MAFTSATISHTFLNPDATPASGKVTFQLTKRMSNGTQTVLSGEVTAALNASGAISVSLYSNADTGTTPTDAQWKCSFYLLGAGEETFYITVPAGGGTVDLASLLPQVSTGG